MEKIDQQILNITSKTEYNKLHPLAYPLCDTFSSKDYLFALNQELEMYEMLETKIVQCDEDIGKLLQEIIDNDPDKKQHYIETKPHKPINKYDGI